MTNLVSVLSMFTIATLAAFFYTPTAAHALALGGKSKEECYPLVADFLGVSEDVVWKTMDNDLTAKNEFDAAAAKMTPAKMKRWGLKHPHKVRDFEECGKWMECEGRSFSRS